VNREGRVLLTLALGCLASCDAGGGHLATPVGPLPSGVVARVGGQEIGADEVARIVRAQRVDAVRARDMVVRDALLARGAEASGLAESPVARLAWRGALARRVLARILADARALPFTDAELRDAAARRWLEVDRPEGFVTVHAVVRFDARADDTLKVRAHALAEAIRSAVVPIADRAGALPKPDGAAASNPRTAPRDDPDPLSAAFREAAMAVPTGGLQVQVEPLPAVAADGRLLIAGDGRLDEAFTRAATALPLRGALSPVVDSPFGAHVILLLERTPPVVLEGQARRAKLGDEIVNERARAVEKKLLADLGNRSSVAPDAAALLGLVAVDQ